MIIETHNDHRINFLDDAYNEVVFESKMKVVPTGNGMRLLIGKHGKRFNVVLLHGDTRLAVVQLIQRFVTADGRMVCEPHSYTKKEYRGRKYAEQIYCWILDNGIILRSCGRQTMSSHHLWMKLSWLYKVCAFNTKTKQYCGLSKIDEKSVVLELSNRR